MTDTNYESYSIGRSQDSDIHFTDPSVSRNHAQLRKYGDGRIKLIDLGSTSGTHLQWPDHHFEAVSEAWIQPSDIVRFGNHLISITELLDATQKPRYPAKGFSSQVPPRDDSNPVNRTQCVFCNSWSPDYAMYCGDCGKPLQAQAPNVHYPNKIYESTGSDSASRYVTFSEAITICLRKFFDIKGRASRSEFWWFLLFEVVINLNIVLFIYIYAISQNLSAHETGNIMGQMLLAARIFFFFPSLTVRIRRLHDIDRSAWNLLWGVTIVGFIFPLFYWAVKEGNRTTNRYG